MPKPSNVVTNPSQSIEGDNGIPSPRSPTSTTDTNQVAPDDLDLADDQKDITSLPPLPKSPASPQVTKETSRGLFSIRNGRNRSRGKESNLRQVPQSFSTNNLGSGTGGNPHPYGQNPGMSTASLSHSNLLESGIENESNDFAEPEALPKSTSAPPNEAEQGQWKPNKHKFHGFLSRSRSIKGEEDSHGKSRLRPPRALDTRPSSRPATDNSRIKTAPLDNDRSFREMMTSSLRNRSADRHAIESDDEHGKQPSSYQSNSGATFFSNIVNTSSKAADGLGKAGKGFFGKLTRAGSSHERDVPDDAYVCRIICLPLIEQTRRTRVKPRLEDAGDKTEFWMPALPYRCIDYLNLHGIEEEGLYRIPGSGIQVKHWQRRFDTEIDINLLNERDLYDINIIGSLFKAWLRELPDEILPKTTQALIAKECVGAKETPQLMKDELSKLPPFNYYLLFAITCHISLLHEHSHKNKMNYHNLCICFQPCMKIDGFCFQFLVQDWRNCWQGCWTEKQYREEEDRYLAGVLGPPSTGHSNGGSSIVGDDRQPTSADVNDMSFHGPQGYSQPISSMSSALTDAPEHQGVVNHSATGRSTPPTLTPVQAISPMRM